MATACPADGSRSSRLRTREAARVAEMVEHACATAVAEGLVDPGDLIAVAAGMPFGVPGSTNLLRIERLSTSRT
jgi:pyruvate kinase